MTQKKAEVIGKISEITPKYVFKIIWATDRPEDGCRVDPDSTYDLYAGDVVQFHNTLDVDAIIPPDCDDLFVESLPLVISAGRRENLTRSESVPPNTCLCNPVCDHTGGGPRFVPKP